MFNKRKDVVVLDKHLVRLEKPPEDSRPKYNKGDKDMKLFFSSDTHYYHSNILKYEDRPFKSIEEMNNALIEKHNNKVGKNDNIYFIGDFSFGNVNQTIDLLNKLNGNKFLIKGNHDHVVKHQEVRDKFGWVKDYYRLKYNGLKIILFHYPIQIFDCQHHGAIHLYGHVHSNKDNHHPMLSSIKNAYNVGVDINGYEPVSLEEILERLDYKVE